MNKSNRQPKVSVFLTLKPYWGFVAFLVFAFKKGKTYTLVGPTGGGKTTTALLIARLYDTTEGEKCLDFGPLGSII